MFKIILPFTMLLGILNEVFQKSILIHDVFLFSGITERDEKLKDQI